MFEVLRGCEWNEVKRKWQEMLANALECLNGAPLCSYELLNENFRV